MSDIKRPNRRAMLKLATGMLASCGVPTVTGQERFAIEEGTIRDRLWLFGVPANVNYPYLHRRSLMTPAEGAYYLSIPNIIIVQVQDQEHGVLYKGFDPPFDQYAVALRPFKRIVWSIVNGGGRTTPEERAQVLDLAIRTPNFVGVYMDDFFSNAPTNEVGSLTQEQLRDIRQQLKTSSKKMDLFVTLYANELTPSVSNYLHLIDVIVMWTWNVADLANLEANLRKLETLTSGSRIFLGCYFFDYETRQPVSVANIKLQCERAMQFFRDGRIEGMVFLTNAVEDVGFECVEWTREWIKSVGDTKI